MSKKFISGIMLLTAAIIWGLSFMVISIGMDSLGTFAFASIKSLLAAIFLFVIIVAAPKISIIEKDFKTDFMDRSLAIKGGILCGIAMFLVTNVQQIGIMGTTSGKAGFITTLYIVIIPTISLFFGEKISKKVILCIIFAIIGFYFMSVNESFDFSKGDILVFISSILMSIHTIMLAKYSPKTNIFELNFYQFLVCGLISLAFALIYETFTFEQVISAMPALLYMSAISGVIAFSLQIYAFRNLNTTIAMMICSLESVIALIGGYIFLNESLTNRELAGCTIVFISIVIAQMPESTKNIQKSN